MINSIVHGRNSKRASSLEGGGGALLIAVDLTSIFPAGGMEDAAQAAFDTLTSLHRLLPDYQFLYFTSESNHAGLSFLESSNSRRRLSLENSYISRQSDPGVQKKGFSRMKKALRPHIPASLFNPLRNFYHSLQSRRGRALAGAESIGPAVLFGPFPGSLSFSPHLLYIPVLGDLRFLSYPQFFNSENGQALHRDFHHLTRHAQKMVCLSSHLRQQVLDHSDMPREKIHVIPFRAFKPSPQPDAGTVQTLLRKERLEGGEFLFYPADFSPHKNHRMLFTAFGLFLLRHREPSLRLVCAGAPNSEASLLREFVWRMGMANRIFIIESPAEDEWAALTASCKAVVFPSLYEGFSKVLLRAMSWSKPLLCSRNSCLPELVGEGGVYYDPRKPEEIVDSLERLTGNEDFARSLGSKAQEQALLFTDTERMTQEYRALLREAFAALTGGRYRLNGVYLDSWTQSGVTLQYPASARAGSLEVTFSLPTGHPHEKIQVKVADRGKTQTHSLQPGRTLHISRPLSNRGGVIAFQIGPTFQPKAYGMNEDLRDLGCLCHRCSICSAAKEENLLERTEGIFRVGSDSRE